MTDSAAASTADPFEEIAALAYGTGSKCNAGPFIESLPQEDRDAITRALDAGYPMAAIGKFCVKRGFRFTDQAIVRHLSGRCSCPKTR